MTQSDLTLRSQLGLLETAGGNKLRRARCKLGLTLRDIEMQSARISAKKKNEEYTIPISRLSDFESKGVIPSIYRLYSLAIVLRRNLSELLSWYGIDCAGSIYDFDLGNPPESYILTFSTTQ